MRVKLAPHQDAAWDDPARFQVRVWHRRAGKTFYTILRMIERIYREGKGDWQALYVAPTRIQAKQIAWPYFTKFAAPMKAQLNVSDLKLEIPGKGFVQLFSGDHYERMRGLYADEVVFDEAADIPPAAWFEVVSPAISDRKGRVTFMGTPKGRLNLLWSVWEHAGGDDDWSRSLLTWRDTNMVEEEEVERNRRQQSEAQFNQEWRCAWDGSTPGAYWAKEMAQAEAQGRVTDIRYDDALPVFASIDLGHSDLMVVVIGQDVGTEHRILDCKAYQYTGLPDVVKDLRKLPYPIDTMICPHDIAVTELGTGRTREESLIALGVNPVRAPKLSLDEGIEQSRQFLKHTWFDREKTKWLREGLAMYRSDYDELRGVFKLKPIHDQASHYADSFRYYATGPRHSAMSWGSKPKGNLGIYA